MEKNKSDTHKIIRVGNVSNGKSQAGMVYSTEGVSQTLCACTHGYAFGYIYVGDIVDNKNKIELGNKTVTTNLNK